MATTAYSYCRNCCACCGTVFEVENNKIVTHKPDRANVSTSGFMCIKGDMAVELHKGAEGRLVISQKRTSEGALISIDQNTLLSEVHARLEDIIARHGPESVALFYGTCAYQKSLTIPIAKEFMRSIGSQKLFSTMTIDQSSHWVTEGRMGVFATGRPFLEDVDLLMLVGTNPIVSHGNIFSALPNANQFKHLKALKARGGKLIIVDPRRTETAAMADIHLQPKPGFDAEIHAALINIILSNDGHKAEFCDRYVTQLGELQRAVASAEPERVAQRAGLQLDKLYEVARALSVCRKPSISFGTGTAMASNPNTAAHMIYALNAICGGYLRAGDVIRNPGIIVARSDVEYVRPPHRSWEQEPKLRSGYGQLYGEFPSSQLPNEILRADGGGIRALFVVGGNPMMALGSPDRVRDAFESLDLLVVIDPRLTETARRADYVVAPPLQYEVHDTTLWADLTSPKPYFQYAAPVVTPPTDTIEEWKFFNALANRMGNTLAVSSFRFGGGTDQTADKLVLDPSQDWKTEEIIEWYCAKAGLPLAALKEHPHGMLPDLPTVVVKAPDVDDGARLELCPSDVQRELSAILGSQEDEEYKYRLISRRIVESMNSAFRDSPITKRRHPTNALYMHPEDLADDGFLSGDGLVVSGCHGSVVAYVKPDATMRRGVVSLTHCWGALNSDDDPLGLLGAHSSRLVSLAIGDVQNIDGMPLQSAIPVNITKIEIVPAPVGLPRPMGSEATI